MSKGEIGAMTDADRERIEGYRDGCDMDSPEPSANRSASYRHGFAVARADRAGRPAFGSAAAARHMASEAEQSDASR